MQRYLVMIAVVGLLPVTACSSAETGDGTTESGQAQRTNSNQGTQRVDRSGEGNTDRSGGDPVADTWSSSGELDAVAGPDAAVSCEPGSTKCEEPFSYSTCSAFGDSWVETPCPDFYGCEAGACHEQLCTPGASEDVCIDEHSFERCSGSGTGWNLITCAALEYCFDEGIGSAACIPTGQYCLPGSTICKGFTEVWKCDDAGSDYAHYESCPAGGSCFNGTCLTPCEVNIKDGSYLGCEYWAIDLDNVGDAEKKAIGLVVTVPAGSAGTSVSVYDNYNQVELDEAALGVVSTFVAPGHLRVFQLPTGYDIDGTMLTNRTFKVTTTAPVAVHQFNPLNGEGVHTNDASLLLPAKVTGQQYYVMSWPHRVYSEGELRGFATVVATQPGTTKVSVEPTCDVVAGGGVPGLEAGKKYLFVLEEGQALNIETAGDEGADLTGTFISADQKISVTGGHECANVPLGIDNCDHLEQQLFALETWSYQYIAAAFKPRSPSQVDIWRVMAGNNDVVVTTNPPVNGYHQFKLQRGQWIQFASPDSFMIEADGPIMVGHYLTGAWYPGAELVCADSATGKESAIGDPAFTLAAPVQRFLSDYTLLTPEGYLENYINVVVPEGESVTIDGVPIDVSQIKPIPGTGYGIAQMAVNPGVHSVKGTAPVGLTVYGYDCDVSYAYPGGMKLQAVGD